MGCLHPAACPSGVGAPLKLSLVPLSALDVRDERAFRHVALYGALKQLLVADGVRLRVPALGESEPSWDRAVFLNLTFWSAEAGGDVLTERSIDADVVAHIAWHHAARKAMPADSVDAHLLGEAIASAFDLYLIGRTLGRGPASGFLETQVPAMAEVADAAGLDAEGFEALLGSVVASPDAAFEDLRALLFDVTRALVPVSGVDAALLALAPFASHRFAPLLHHFELSNWVLYARALGEAARAPDPVALAVDADLRAAPESLAWLASRWLGEEL